MSKRSAVFLPLILCLLFLMCLPAAAEEAGWSQQADGSYIFTTANGKTLSGTYFADKGAGIVKNGKYYYCYREDGTKLTGWLKNGSSWYYFRPSKGRMAVNRRLKIKKKYYYFRDDGVRVVKTWVGRRYYGRNGAQVFRQFVGLRYVGANGKFVTGGKTVNGNFYYFNPTTGNMTINDVVTLDGKSWYFNSEGIGRRSTASGVVVESSYFSDPKVNDKTLLSAIIYCESGNQPYYGQLAVGLVIMNRVKSPLFPNTLKEVLYAADQFEPCRNTWMTQALKGEIAVTDSCKKAAAEALTRAKSGNYVIETVNGKKVNMKGYFFFMTPSAYTRLGLKSTKLILKDHVFFKNWV